MGPVVPAICRIVFALGIALLTSERVRYRAGKGPPSGHFGSLRFSSKASCVCRPKNLTRSSPELRPASRSLGQRWGWLPNSIGVVREDCPQKVTEKKRPWWLLFICGESLQLAFGSWPGWHCHLFQPGTVSLGVFRLPGGRAWRAPPGSARPPRGHPARWVRAPPSA